MKNKKGKKKPNIGKWLLSRYCDGLYYRSKILNINEDAETCEVQYEDNQKFISLLKDVQFKPDYGEERTVFCRLCKESFAADPSYSFKGNKIISCDACEWAWHQKCHNPPIIDGAKFGGKIWECRDCAFARGQCQDGPAGALKPNTSEGANMLRMKKFLPYNKSKLTWDTHHEYNKEQCYCYCGGPGEWYMKMLQCARCLQWYHEACLQCLDFPLLNGDTYYLFVCALCNEGNEFLRRLDMTWSDLVHLTIFHLTVERLYKFHDFDGVVSWIDSYWNNLQMSDKLSAVSRFNRCNILLDILKQETHVYRNGLETRHGKRFWSLRKRFPRIAARPLVPAKGVVCESVLIWDVDAKPQQRLTLGVMAHSTVFQSSPEYREWKRSMLTDSVDELKKSAKKKLDVIHIKEKPAKKKDTSVKASKEKVVETEMDEDHRKLNMYKAATSLDELFPKPNSFAGAENPFLTEAEKLSLKSKQIVNGALIKHWELEQKAIEDKERSEREELQAANEYIRQCAAYRDNNKENSQPAAAKSSSDDNIKTEPFQQTVKSQRDESKTKMRLPSLNEALSVVRKRKLEDEILTGESTSPCSDDRRVAKRPVRRVNSVHARKGGPSVEALALEGVQDKLLHSAISRYHRKLKSRFAQCYPFTIYARRKVTSLSDAEYLVHWNKGFNILI